MKQKEGIGRKILEGKSMLSALVSEAVESFVFFFITAAGLKGFGRVVEKTKSEL